MKGFSNANIKRCKDVSENDSSDVSALAPADTMPHTTLPSTSMNIVTDALATGIGSSTAGSGGIAGESGGDGGGGGGAGDDGGGGSSSSEKEAIYCIPLQYIELPPILIDSYDHYYISDTVPSSDNKYLLVVVKYDANIKKHMSNKTRCILPSDIFPSKLASDGGGGRRKKGNIARHSDL